MTEIKGEIIDLALFILPVGPLSEIKCQIPKPMLCVRLSCRGAVFPGLVFKKNAVHYHYFYCKCPGFGLLQSLVSNRRPLQCNG